MNNYAFCFKCVKSYLLFKISHGKTRQLTIWLSWLSQYWLIWPIPLYIPASEWHGRLSVSNSFPIGRRCYQATSLLPVRSIIAHGRAGWCCWGWWCCIQTAGGATPRWLDSPTMPPASISSDILLVCIKAPPWAVLVLPFTMLGSSWQIWQTRMAINTEFPLSFKE